MREVSVIGIRLELPTNQPMVVLRENDGERVLPIWIGAVEASAIDSAQKGYVTPRPLTHDLLRDVLAALNVGVTRIEITEIQDRVFFASLVLSSGVTVSARPSDAIALALRVHAPVFVDEGVLDEAGLTVTAEGEDEEAGDSAGALSESDVEEFRAFLDRVTPEDFGSDGPQA